MFMKLQLKQADKLKLRLSKENRNEEFEASFSLFLFCFPIYFMVTQTMPSRYFIT